MKFTILLTSLSLCHGYPAEIFPGAIGMSGAVEERRASATGKKLDSFLTMAGRIYRDVVITKITDGGLSFTHKDGAARLRFEDLSPQQRRYFGIEEENAKAVYDREQMERITYETTVEEREKVRRKSDLKDATERAEARRLISEKAQIAEAKRAAAATIQPAAEIPLLPTIKRVDSDGSFSRRYRSHYSSYGNYCARYYPSSGIRFGGYRFHPGYDTRLNFSFR